MFQSRPRIVGCHRSTNERGQFYFGLHWIELISRTKLTTFTLTKFILYGYKPIMVHCNLSNLAIIDSRFESRQSPFFSNFETYFI